MELIDKSKVVAELEKRIAEGEKVAKELPSSAIMGLVQAYKNTLSFIDTLEVKEVGEKFEHPNIEAKDAVEVSSRMPHIDKRLLPIAEFIMDYASWNLHKDEWNQPVIEVPLFRVLDALVQKGKPYCEG